MYLCAPYRAVHNQAYPTINCKDKYCIVFSQSGVVIWNRGCHLKQNTVTYMRTWSVVGRAVIYIRRCAAGPDGRSCFIHCSVTHLSLRAPLGIEKLCRRVALTLSPQVIKIKSVWMQNTRSKSVFKSLFCGNIWLKDKCLFIRYKSHSFHSYFIASNI